MPFNKYDKVKLKDTFTKPSGIKIPEGTVGTVSRVVDNAYELYEVDFPGNYGKAHVPDFKLELVSKGNYY